MKNTEAKKLIILDSLKKKKKKMFKRVKESVKRVNMQMVIADD